LACASLLACTRTDLVATRVVRDAQVDSGCDDASSCADARVDDAQVDAQIDAGCRDAADCGTPQPVSCAAEGCSSLANRDEFCSAARPASVVIGDSCDPLTGPTFEYAVCTCGGLVTNSPFEVDSLDDAAAPNRASVAINDELQLGPDTSIDGSLYVTGRYEAMAAPRVSGSVFQRAAPKCDCDPTHYLDIAALIAASSRENDNARAQLTATTLSGLSSGRSLSLDCGRYYFDRATGRGLLQIEARGRVAIFIAGDLSLDDGLTLTLQNGASAEIYVGGNVRVVGRLELSTSNDGNRVLLVVNGTGTINLTSGIIDGTIYAPRSEIVTRGPLEIHGSMFVRRASFGDATRVRYVPLVAARSMCVAGSK
jgi:hypothetical protein